MDCAKAPLHLRMAHGTFQIVLQGQSHGPAKKSKGRKDGNDIGWTNIKTEKGSGGEINEALTWRDGEQRYKRGMYKIKMM